MKEPGLDNRHRDHARSKTGEIQQKRSDALNKNLPNPISQFLPNATAPKPAWRSKPSWFLIAEEDRMINPKTQHFMANRMRARTHTFAVDHAPLLTAPEKALEVIIAAAQETLSERTHSPSLAARFS